jgi:nitroimidazol reductase NimA-like FMN-containing flavoprotein (pyridoxamine 5'-phosphate oxidase superfamily)
VSSPTARRPEAVEELSAVACERRLRTTPIGRVGLIVDGHPEIFPVNYTVDEAGDLYFRTDPGAKLDALRHAETIALEIDGVDEERHSGWSVLVVGRAYRVADPDRLEAVATTGLRPWAAGEKVNVVRLVPDKTTGRYLPPGHERTV